MKNYLSKFFLTIMVACMCLSAEAASLIPTGALTTALADIEDTGQDAFGLVIPVLVTIMALVVGAKLVKRFLSKV